MKVFRGKIVHSKVPEKIEVLHDYIIGFRKEELGKIVFLEPASKLDELAAEYGFKKDEVRTLEKSQFLMPGLVDTHIHAPQYPNSGTGYDRMLLDWLKKYTFPTEQSFADVKVAKEVYPLVVKRTLRHGTTTACYFATIHLESSLELCRIIDRLGQRALVGKVCMDNESPENYVETTQQSLEDTRKFIDGVQAMKNPLLSPIVTPRFAPTCTGDLLAGLGEIAREKGVHVQSHICEQIPEVAYTLKLFPDHEHSASIFEKAGLLTDKTVMAHCIHLEEKEVELFQQRSVGISHCPNSNLSLSSGILDTRKMLDRGMKLGLGTDISGGYSPSIMDSMRLSVDCSRALSFFRDEGYRGVSHHEAFYMGTVGGARVLAMEDKIGNFEVGKQFDALLIDTAAPLKPAPVFDTFDKDTFEDILMKFFYLGDDRNIACVFVAGAQVLLD